ncbi:hypothetical protein BGAL_0079g00040 [Botrytis galanthina]|uniref:Uncharacterized protein n=1 Tax=Botrytis galanthina TaxID=278940 RepID=A0A4S8R3L1_9HELO|nr:hypothetical protein BGAL_0079g00040 [Botrytis galanthina]
MHPEVSDPRPSYRNISWTAETMWEQMIASSCTMTNIQAREEKYTSTNKITGSRFEQYAVTGASSTIDTDI